MQEQNGKNYHTEKFGNRERNPLNGNSEVLKMGSKKSFRI